MGTEIIDNLEVYVKRTYQGIDKGTCFYVKINKLFTQKEFSSFLARCLQGLIVEGEGIKHTDDEKL